MVETVDLIDLGIGILFELSQHGVEKQVFRHARLEFDIRLTAEQHDRRRIGRGMIDRRIFIDQRLPFLSAFV